MKRWIQMIASDIHPDPVAGGHAAIRLVTWPLSCLYAALTLTRRWLYDRGLLRQRRLPGLVVSVGNIAIGGTGKSPLVMDIARRLSEAGARCAILTRGYGSGLQARDVMVVRDGEILLAPAKARVIPDEARMQSQALAEVPVIVGPKRWAAAQTYLKWCASQGIMPPTHWILDDGFQHRALIRDFDIVLVDGKKPLGQGYLLPRGPLREPPSSLKRAHLVIATYRGTDDLAPQDGALLRPYWHGPLLRVILGPGTLKHHIDDSAESFVPERHAPVAAVCGIARPQAFFDDLARLEISVGQRYAVLDHEAFDLERLREVSGHALSIVTTAKDYWRDPSLFADLGKPVFILSQKVDLVDSDWRSILHAVWPKE